MSRLLLGRQNGAELRVALARAVMEYRMSSYRAIMASTAAILNSEATRIPEEPTCQDEKGLGTVEAPDEGVVRDIADHRFQLVFDLFYTERQYLIQLESVLDTYAEPFRKFTALSREDHQILFVGLEPIVCLCAMVLSKLDDAVQSWDPATTKIGNVFSSKYWKYYDDYANSYGAIKSTLENKYANDESFVEFLHLRQGSSPFSLEDLLSLPVQRIPEYDKYLNELLQETDQSHPDFEDLKRAADKVRNMVREREDELYNMDNQKRMERVQDKFPHDDLQLRDLDTQRSQLASRRKSAPGAVLFKTLGKSKSTNNILAQGLGKNKELEFFRPSRQFNFNRQYLMEGLVEFSRGMQTQDRYLFLFSDLLLVAKQKSTTTFKLKHRIRVCELWISFCIDDVTELTRPADRSFVIGWPTTNVVATFKSFDLKETWLNKLTEQIEEERGKQVPKSLVLEIMNKEVDKSCEVEVEPESDARTIVQSCLQLLQIADSEVKDYQLWVRLGNDESPYPLIGHELPYSIKMSHIRDYGKRSEDTLNEVEVQHILTEMNNNNNNRKYEFVLKHNKKSPKKHSLEEHSGTKKSKRKSPLINLFRKNREDKKPTGKLFGHQLSNITTPDELIAKPVKELLTILFREGPYTVGILRKSPNAKMLKELRQKIDDGEDCLCNETWPTLVIGALLKDFLRNIPQSLLMEEYYDDWVAANEIADGEDKINKLRLTISKLPPCHFELLRHLMCVLHYIDKRSEENKMTAYNLSVCIAPSLLWPKGNPDPLATPPAVVQYMIENCGQVFGEESLMLFGEAMEHKLRQDSSTDSDSMHSVLSTHSNFRRDDSSIDSLEREFYLQESSPRLLKSHHLSPSNISGDSGLTMSDSQLYDDDGNEIGDRRHYTRSASQFIDRDIERPESEASRSLDNQYFYRYGEHNPVPPPRRNRRKDTVSPNLEHYRKPMRFSSYADFHIPGKYDLRQNQNNDRYVKYPRKMSSESLKSVEEASEMDSERKVKDWHSRPDIGTLIKSASGAHLYYEDFRNLQLYEFDTNNETVNHRRQLYKQKSCPISPQSKYSLSSSRDSVLSDSSGSYLERQYYQDTMSSSVETPETEDRSMAEWLSQQSKQVAYGARRQQRLRSHDDSEVGLTSDSSMVHKSQNKGDNENQAMRNVQHLVSPHASPKIKRRAPIPLSVRRSFPIENVTTPKGSGSNTSKEAEDIITSPKLTITYCSQDSLDKRDSEKEKTPGISLDIYNNNSQLALKQLNRYSSGLQGTSPPPRVVLQNLSQSTEKRDSTPVKASYDSAILSQVHRNSIETGRRNSLDMGDLRAHRYPMEENSVSSEDEQSESSDSEEIESYRVTEYINMGPFKYSIPQKLIPSERKSNSSESLSKISKKSSSSESLSKTSRQSSSQESLSRHSTTSEESISNRPENPPSYQEALHRKFLLENNMPLEDNDEDTIRQQQASQRAKQLYEQSMRQYQEQKDRYPPLPSQQFEQKLDAVGEHHENMSESDSQMSSDDDDIEWAEKNPRRLYEESLKRYMAEQTQSPLVKTTSTDDGGISRSKGGQIGQKNLLHVSGLHRSHSDVGDVNKRLRSPLRDQGSPTITNSSKSSSRESTPTRRPEHPPPYDSPPPYRHGNHKSSPMNADRHYFPKADKLFYQSPASNKQTSTQVSQTGQGVSDKLSVTSRNGAQTRTNQEVSHRSRPGSRDDGVSKTAQTSGRVQRDSGIDNTVHSAHVDISKYKSPVRNIHANDVTNIRSKDNVVIIRSHNASQDSLLRQQPKKQAGSDSHSKVHKTSSGQTASSSPVVFRPRASSLEPRESPEKQTDHSGTSQLQVTRSSPHGPGAVLRSGGDKVQHRSVELSKTDSAQRRNSLDAAITRTAASSSLGGQSGKELPWSVKNIRTMFDKSKHLDSSNTDSESSTVSASQSSDSTPRTSPNPPVYTPPLQFQRHSNTSRSSTSSNSSVNSNTGYKGVGSNRNTYTGRYGPQTRGDSFSSSDSSDCSCRYSLKCHRDDSSLEDLNNLSFTDISYV